MLYQNIKGDLHENFFVFVGRWKSCWNLKTVGKTPLNKLFRKILPFVFKALDVMIVFYVLPFPIRLLKNLENLCGNASSCFVSHLPLLLPSLRALICFTFYASSCLSKQFAGYRRMSTAMLQGIISFSIQARFTFN